MTTHLDKETALHMTACFSPDVTSPDVMSGMARIAELLLNNGSQVNAQDTAGRFAHFYFVSGKLLMCVY